MVAQWAVCGWCGCSAGSLSADMISSLQVHRGLYQNGFAACSSGLADPSLEGEILGPLLPAQSLMCAIAKGLGKQRSGKVPVLPRETSLPSQECRWYDPVFPTQNGKVAIVTGGAKGIGYQTVKHLARLGMHVVIAGNSESEGQKAVRKIKEETLTGKVEFLYCDLASMKSIRQFVQRFRAKNCPLHVLVNNAGVMLVPERKTEDGFEEHFGLNYLGHFLLTNLLLDMLKQSGTHSHNARIITVSSATHYVGKLHLNDLQSRCSYSPHGAYAQSKLALVLFTYRLQHLLTANGSHVTANVVDPGVVNTELYKHVFWVVKVVKWMTAWLCFKTPEEGASTTIYAAVSPEMEGAGGCYLYNEERTKSADIAYDEELQRRLWTESCKMVGISDETSRLH
ncbi:dehydrogenase/reductase SDR family member on chromosome X isoform X1 [Neopelma chrysocephalum]|uniref:dehydrogenase/reductase SDR family member on chromosome X isoform X1 n=1 Tax=Neopelma chrysocephalum TaxID=114329 RepID=UPI000FCD1004|nr:dehydrogenase/reductase SDR family member on chromosome X isoform X1 [Neopelma chrysocephalum]